MINLKTFERILENPQERIKLFDSNFDLTIFDNYASKYAVKNLDLDLLSRLNFLGIDIDENELFQQLINAKYSPENKFFFRNQIKKWASSAELWDKLHYELLRNGDFNFETFARYFIDYADSFHHEFKESFFTKRTIYSIQTQSICDFIVKMIELSIMPSKVYIPHGYFADKSLEGTYKLISEKYFEQFVVACIKYTNMDGQHRVTHKLIRWIRDLNFSSETLRLMMEMRDLDELNRELFEEVLKERLFSNSVKDK